MATITKLISQERQWRRCFRGHYARFGRSFKHFTKAENLLDADMRYTFDRMRNRVLVLIDEEEDLHKKHALNQYLAHLDKFYYTLHIMREKSKDREIGKSLVSLILKMEINTSLTLKKFRKSLWKSSLLPEFLGFAQGWRERLDAEINEVMRKIGEHSLFVSSMEREIVDAAKSLRRFSDIVPGIWVEEDMEEIRRLSGVVSKIYEKRAECELELLECIGASNLEILTKRSATLSSPIKKGRAIFTEPFVFMGEKLSFIWKGVKAHPYLTAWMFTGSTFAVSALGYTFLNLSYLSPLIDFSLKGIAFLSLVEVARLLWKTSKNI